MINTHSLLINLSYPLELRRLGASHAPWGGTKRWMVHAHACAIPGSDERHRPLGFSVSTVLLCLKFVNELCSASVSLVYLPDEPEVEVAVGTASVAELTLSQGAWSALDLVQK